MKYQRITFEVGKMGGVACIRGLRIPVATVVAMVADGMTTPEILAKAKSENRIVISADTDFGTLLSQNRENAPSVILIRRISDRHPAKQAAIIIENLPSLKEDLLGGAVVVFDEERIRVRPLPLR
jgi:predicted nuclease of predicted toxin-antitoxin system